MAPLETETVENLARFGHHPDPVIDFFCEVEALDGKAYNRLVGFDPEPDIEERIGCILGNAPVAYSILHLGFRVGGDPACVAAKQRVRRLEEVLADPQREQTARRDAILDELFPNRIRSNDRG